MRLVVGGHIARQIFVRADRGAHRRATRRIGTGEVDHDGSSFLRVAGVMLRAGPRRRRVSPYVSAGRRIARPTHRARSRCRASWYTSPQWSVFTDRRSTTPLPRVNGIGQHRRWAARRELGAGYRLRLERARIWSRRGPALERVPVDANRRGAASPWKLFHHFGAAYSGSTSYSRGNAAGATSVRGAVLAGGAASRYGGRPKGLLEVGGRRILDRVVEALRLPSGPRRCSSRTPPTLATWRPDLRCRPGRPARRGESGRHLHGHLRRPRARSCASPGTCRS